MSREEGATNTALIHCRSSPVECVRHSTLFSCVPKVHRPELHPPLIFPRRNIGQAWSKNTARLVAGISFSPFEMREIRERERERDIKVDHHSAFDSFQARKCGFLFGGREEGLTWGARGMARTIVQAWGFGREIVIGEICFLSRVRTFCCRPDFLFISWGCVMLLERRK